MNEAEKTLWCGNLSPEVDEELLFELFLQAGPVENVVIPKEKDGCSKGYGFVMFKHEISVLYSIELMKSVTLFGRRILPQHRLSTVSNHQRRASLQDHRFSYQPNIAASASALSGFNIPVLGAQLPYIRNPLQMQAPMLARSPMPHFMVPQYHKQNHQRRRTHHGGFLFNENYPDGRGNFYNVPMGYFSQGAPRTENSPNILLIDDSEDKQKKLRSKEEQARPKGNVSRMPRDSGQGRSYRTIYDRRHQPLK